MTAIRAKADLSSLPVIRDYVLSTASQANLTGDIPPKLDLVLEEVLVNVANHAYGPHGGDVEVECSVQENGEARTFCFELRDWGTYFDPLAAEKPDTSAGIDERPIGGLGLLLVTTLADDCQYHRQGDMNVLTLCFNAEM